MKNHMPEGADPKDNFKDYLLGTYDFEPLKQPNGHQRFAE